MQEHNEGLLFTSPRGRPLLRPYMKTLVLFNFLACEGEDLEALCHVNYELLCLYSDLSALDHTEINTSLTV